MYKPFGAPEEVESPTLVERVAEPERIEYVIPAVSGDKLVVLPKKHDNVFCEMRNRLAFISLNKGKK